MKMMTITNQKNGITMTIPQNLFWVKWVVKNNRQERLNAGVIERALLSGNHDRARELLGKCGYDVEFFYVYDRAA